LPVPGKPIIGRIHEPRVQWSAKKVPEVGGQTGQ